MENTNKIDFLAIGDIVVDNFIMLEDAHVHCNVDNAGCELCLRFGDKVPYKSSSVVSGVGNSPNAAVSASRLGLNTAIITNIGDDQNGKNCLHSLAENKVRTELISIQKDKATNYHYILSYDIDRTILIKHTAFDYEFPTTLPPISWIYLSSLAENSIPYQMEIVNFLKNHPETKLAFQPGTFQIKIGKEALKEVYKHTEIFFCNLEESQRILGSDSRDLLELSKGIKALGPKIVAISDGINGAYLYYNDELWHNTIYPDIATPLERTGAGDAFSSTITCGIALGKTPLEAFTWGPINSMFVIQKIGAQAGLLSREKLEECLKNAPKDYKTTKVS